MRYAELHAHSAYSFLDGASMPRELVKRAVELELEALAITDHDGLPGVVQLASAAREYGLPTVIGSEISMEYREPGTRVSDLPIRHTGGELGVPQARSTEARAGRRDPQAAHLLVLARDADGYRKLSNAIGSAMLDSGIKGEAAYTLEGLAQRATGSWQILTGCRKGHVRRALERDQGIWARDNARAELDRLVALFGRDNVAVEISNHGQPLDRERNCVLVELARQAKVEYVATGNVHMASIADSQLADVLAATRANETLESMRGWLPAWPAYLRSAREMHALHPDHPEAVEMAADIGALCAFDLSLVAPNLPPFPVPEGHTEATWLRTLVEEKACERYGPRSPQTEHAWSKIDHELEVIIQLGFPGYFLIVHEIVEFCHLSGIWCQGRGSAANSAVCFALGITAVDAVKHNMLFERFLSPGRSGPPDIDVDIEARRREEVIQHVYQRYGRQYAAQVANVITYRPRSAIRDAARALGYDQGQADRWNKTLESRIYSRQREQQAPSTPSFRATWHLSDEVPLDVQRIAAQLQRLPRHLGIHSGGMVLCDRPIIDVCPVGWATMEGRTVLQWDKDDCAEAGLVKFDLLGLGMLTALRLAFSEITARGVRGIDGKVLDLHNIEQDDERVYDLLCAADTVGVFQVESRAQMSTLPRLRPRNFYDIVIEVALIRPGPIQGNSVNPYLARRRGREAVTYPHPLLKNALEKTLGVPLFQEQLMQIAIDTAGFTPAQADRLRKAMGAKRSHERMAQLRSELLDGMAAKGIDEPTAEHIYEKLEAFAEFGFPESHSFSFAYLVYASAWLKVHYPENFYAGLLGAQPMGFYSAQSLVADARAHGVEILPIDVSFSYEHSSVEETAERAVKKHPLVDADPRRGLRLGLSNIKGLGEKTIQRILAAREKEAFANVADLARRAELTTKDVEALAGAGALASLNVSRREGIWAAEAVSFNGVRAGQWFQPTLVGTEVGIRAPRLIQMSPVEENVADLSSTGISPFHHPIEFVRDALSARGILQVAQTIDSPVETRIRVAGIVTHRQRPHTASGITFLSIEDETGLLNVVCRVAFWTKYRKILRGSQALILRGMVEKADGAVNFVADGVEPLPLHITQASRDFR